MRAPWLKRRGQKAPLRRLRTGTADWVYTEQGSGPPLLLIHGLSGSTAWWRRNIPALTPHYTVYAVELLGFGSNRGRVLPLRASAQGLGEFMDTLELEQAHIVGHSMGGHTAIHFAAQAPARVNRLVLVAPSGLLHGRLVPMAYRAFRAGTYAPIDFGPVAVRDAFRAGPFNLLRAARELLRDNVQELLSLIRAPTLVVAGERDVLVPPALCQQVAQSVAGAEYAMVSRAGHNVMWDQADAFNELLLRFLQETECDQPLTALHRAAGA